MVDRGFCVGLPLSCYLINLPRRHLIPDTAAHLSPVFTSGVLSKWDSPHSRGAPKGVGAAGIGDTVSQRMGVNVRVEECRDRLKELSCPQETHILSCPREGRERSRAR